MRPTHRAFLFLLLAATSPAFATDPQFGAIRIEASPNVRHAFVSAQAQSSNAAIVSKNEWNAAHTVPTALIASVPTGFVWPAQPAALTEFCGGSTEYRWRANLTNHTSIRLTAQVVTAGAASAALRLQYTLDTTGASGWDYLDSVSGPSVSISSTGVSTSATVAIATAAKAEVLLRLVGINGDGAGGQACYSAIKAGTAALADAATSATTATTASTAAALAADGANCPAGSAPLGVDASGAAQGCFAVPTGTGTVSGNNTGDQTITLTGGVTGTGAGSFEATVVTNANLTGPITSVGNATTVADSELAALAGLTSAADKLPYFTGAGLAAIADFSSANRAGLAALSGTNTGDQTTITGNAGTATALAANGANCSPGTFPLGVDAAGASEDCTAISTTLSTTTATSGLTASLLATDGSALIQGPTYAPGSLTIDSGVNPVSTLVLKDNGQNVFLVANEGLTSITPRSAGATLSLTGFATAGSGPTDVLKVNTGATTDMFAINSQGSINMQHWLNNQQARFLRANNVYGGTYYDAYTFIYDATANMGGNTLLSFVAHGSGSGHGVGTLISGLFRSTLIYNSITTSETDYTVGGSYRDETPEAANISAPSGSGTNIVGARLTLHPGRATGSAVGGDLKVATSVPTTSGTTLQTLGDRSAYLSKYTALAEATPTSFARVAIASGTVSGGDMLVTVEAADATDYQSRTLHYSWSASNKAGTLSFGLSTPAEGVGPSTGTLTCTITLVDAGSGNLDHKADCTSSLTQTVLRANAQVRKNFGDGAISAQ